MIELPGYIFEKQLGHGGMAKVYLARHIGLDRLVAIKVLSKDLHGDESFSQRFIREARIVANLTHQNIITVHDVGVYNEFHYIAMEYLPGETLDDKIKKKMNGRQILNITKQIAAALDFAHKKNIVHRDVKPDNILFREDGTAVLTDFGIARTTTSETKMTAAGTVIGTPHYMSPEQAQGLEIGPWSDIYSLGIVLFEMLNGKVPFDADSTIAVVFKHITEPVPDLDEPHTQYQPLVNTMLAKKTESRYQSGREVIADIEALDRGETPANATLIFNQTAINPAFATTTQEPTKTTVPLQQTKSKKTGVFAGLAVITIALIVSAVILLPIDMGKINNTIDENSAKQDEINLAYKRQQQQLKQQQLKAQQQRQQARDEKAAANALIQQQQREKEQQLTAELEQEKLKRESAERTAQQKQSKAEAETLNAKRELWALKKKQLEQRKKTAAKAVAVAPEPVAEKPIHTPAEKTKKSEILAGDVNSDANEYVSDLLKAADNALQTDHPISAKINYEKVLQINANNKRAKQGLENIKNQANLKVNNNNSAYIKDLLKAADNALSSDRFSSAMANYKKVLQQSTQNQHAINGMELIFKRRLQLALSEAQDGDFDDAQDHINAARKMSPGNPEIDLTIKKINQLQNN